jgi:hypothetical protein
MKAFLLLLGVLLLLVIGTGFYLPKQVEVEREIIIQRPAATVYTVLNGFRSYARWSPMVSGDPGVALRPQWPGVWTGRAHRVVRGSASHWHRLARD